MGLKLNLEGINSFLNWEDSIKQMQPKVKSIHKKLHQDSELEKKIFRVVKITFIKF